MEVIQLGRLLRGMEWRLLRRLFLLRCRQLWITFRGFFIRWPAYHYSPLQDPLRDIRLITVLPGSFYDDMRIQIHHAKLETKTPRPSMRLSLPEIKKTLPPAWAVTQTQEGRYLFIPPPTSREDSTWDHPDTTLEPCAYRVDAEAANSMVSELGYSALSYVWGSAFWLFQRTVLIECVEAWPCSDPN